MKFILSLLSLTVIIALASASPQLKLPTNIRLSSGDKNSMRQIPNSSVFQLCDVNVCFVLGDSDSISPTDFSALENFMHDVEAILSVEFEDLRTFTRARFLHCFNLLRRRRGVKKIVLLGESVDLGRNPVKIANRFRRTGGEVCAVEVGSANTSLFLDIVGGDPSKILTVDDFFALSDIIDDLTPELCK